MHLFFDVDGKVDDAFFEVEINKSPRDQVRIGKQTVIGLPPYNTYDVILKPRGSTLVNFNDQRQSATLYPGNVVTMKWTASKIIVAFGRIVDAKNEPVANALIKGVSGLAVTDEFGLFQAEIDTSVERVDVQTREMTCSAQLPEYSPDDNITLLGDLICK